jgi:hypothetical protein
MKPVTKLLIVFLGLVVFFALVCGCVGTGEQRESKQAPVPKVTKAPAVTQPQTRTFSGNGNEATSPFYLNSGLVKFKYKGSGGDMNFIAHLMDAKTGKMEAIGVVNEIGEADGSSASRVAAGDYVLDVTYDGAWTIEVIQ